MTQDDDDKPVALLITEAQLRDAVRRLHGVYLARGHHTWSYWRNTEDGDVFDRVWAETRGLPDRPEIRPAGGEGVTAPTD